MAEVVAGFQDMRKLSAGGDLFTSDVTGMDFSLGSLALAAAYYAMLCTTERSEAFNRAAIAYAYCEADPMYLIGKEL